MFALRSYEDASPSYTGIDSHPGLRRFGLYDTVIAIDEALNSGSPCNWTGLLRQQQSRLLTNQAGEQFESQNVLEDVVVGHEWDVQPEGVAATQRSASCSFWPSAWPLRTQAVHRST